MKPTVETEREPSTEVIVACIGCVRRELRPARYWSPRYLSPTWLRADTASGYGVCSHCPELVRAWDKTHTKTPELIRATHENLPATRSKRIWGIRHLRYWWLKRELAGWLDYYEGPGISANPAYLRWLEAVWRGEA